MTRVPDPTGNFNASDRCRLPDHCYGAPVIHRCRVPGNAGPRSVPDALTAFLTAPAAVMVAVLLTMVLLLSACGADAETGSDGDPGPNSGGQNGEGPRVADARFEGDFLVEQLSDGSGPVPLFTTPSINFETVFGGLTVKPGCNTYFGSFTLAEDGTASMTVAGGSTEDCGGLAPQEEAILETLASVTSWTEVDGGFRLDGTGGRSILLRR